MKTKSNSPSRGSGPCRIASLNRLTPLAPPTPASADRPAVMPALPQDKESENYAVLVDFRAVRNIDSHALARFMAAMQRISASGGRLVLFGVCDEVRRIFAVTQLDQVFPIYATREEALTHEVDRPASEPPSRN